jgi:hypothetical protein
MDLHLAFKIAARKIAQQDRAYTELHKAHGIEETHWELLTQAEYWTPDQARAIRSILANVSEVSMTIAGMPAIPLPGQYVAALIAEVVAPCNWMLASIKAPDTFDAFDATGIMDDVEVEPMKHEQMMALVLAYGGGYTQEPTRLKLKPEIVEEVKKANQSTKSKALN